MTRVLRRYWYGATVLGLLFGIVATGAFLVAYAGDDLRSDIGKLAIAAASPSPTAAPSPTPGSAMARSPIGIEMPEGTDCQACHTTADGSIGAADIPVMAHPLIGWRDCTACHSTGRLVTSAPGHTGLHKDQCLVCHQTPDEAGVQTTAPLRPEHMGTDGRQCTDCHGVDDHAPLPASMAGRGNNCWICHNGPEFRYLFEEGASPSSPSAAPPADEDPAASAAPVTYRLDAPPIR